MSPMSDAQLREELAKLYMKIREMGLNPVVPPPSADVDDDTEPFVEPGEVEDKRLRSRKVYFLTADADTRTTDIPARPSGCRRVFRYLQKFEVGTVKQIALTLGLEKKTIGNCLAALAQVTLVTSAQLPSSSK